ncbi:NRDE family protein [Geopsychrobacter electrodiphilus]|uniref:NRDE family protein n=1 Tax=Geopsychrobacter electrodiphilus TaxID=225196 RepID=UPI000380A72F|nr:NRDE family protein [Geopsychrobacter electrodiphilus]
MCLILLAWRCHPEYPLIVAANRDEFYRRSTAAAHWWPEQPDLLAGRDLEAQGTWMGMTRSGRFAAVTNVREPQLAVPAARSRGELTCGYLGSDTETQDYARQLQKTSDLYSGYNLLYGSQNGLTYYSNRLSAPLALKPGLYGLSNAQLDTPWPKVQQGKAQLQALLARSEFETSDLLRILDDSRLFPDELLPATGVSLERERQLSALRISGTDYGTRSSTALLVNRRGQVIFHEKNLAPEPTSDIRFSFALRSS